MSDEELTPLRFVEPVPAPYEEDCRRIQRIARERGYAISLKDAEAAWDAFSDTLAAGWIGLDDEDEAVWCDVKKFLAPA